MAVHATPLRHDGVFRQAASQLVWPHETLPPHEPEPLQHSVLVCAPLCTVPEHEGDPLHAIVQLAEAVQVTFPLHAWSPHATPQVLPPQVTLPRQETVSQVTSHWSAVHVTSCWQEL